jgi:uncharacterized iron-regulated membrane protein
MNPTVVLILGTAPMAIFGVVLYRKRVPLTPEKAVRMQRNERRMMISAGVAAALTLAGLVGHNWGVVVTVFPFALVTGVGAAYFRFVRSRM